MNSLCSLCCFPYEQIEKPDNYEDLTTNQINFWNKKGNDVIAVASQMTVEKWMK